MPTGVLSTLPTLAIAAAGLGLLVGTPPDGRAADALLPGVASALAAGACFAAISLLGARPEPDYHDLTGTGLAFVAGGVAVLGLAAATGPVGFEPSWASAALLLALGLVPSAVAYLAYLRGLRTQSGTTGALRASSPPTLANGQFSHWSCTATVNPHSYGCSTRSARVLPPCPWIASTVAKSLLSAACTR